MDYLQQAVIGLPLATFLGIQAMLFRRMMNTYQKSDVDDKLGDLRKSIEKKFDKHDEALTKNTEALNEVALSIAVLTTKLEERS